MILLPILYNFQPEIQSLFRIFMLIIVLCMTLTKEQIDDWKTYLKNKLLFHSDNQYDSDQVEADQVEAEQEADQSDSDQVDKSEGKIISKHFQVLKDIENTKFKTKIFHLTFNYKCKNEYVNIKTCFCKICGNYICFQTENPPKNAICNHYELFDCTHPDIDDFSGHIHIRDQEKVMSTLESLLQAKDNSETKEFYKAKLKDFVYDDTHAIILEH